MEPPVNQCRDIHWEVQRIVNELFVMHQLFLTCAVPLSISSNHLSFWTNADLDPIVMSFPTEVY